MTNETTIIRDYKDGDEVQIIDVLSKSFKKWPGIDISVSKLDHWKWKFQDDPVGTSLIMVIEDSGKIVGCWHRIISKININNHELIAAQGADIAILPEYQGKGLSSKLRMKVYELEEKGKIDFTYGFTSHPKILMTAYKGKQVKLPGVITEYIKINDINKYIMINNKPFLKTFLYYYLSHQLNKFTNLMNKKNIENCDIKKIDLFDENINKFYNKIIKKYGFITIKDKKYLNWRYCDYRSAKYNIFTLLHNEEIMGYAIISIKDNEGYIVELLSSDDDENIYSCLINECIKYFDENKINVIRYLITENHPYATFIQKYGFVNNHADRFINYYDRGSYLEDVLKNRSKILFQFGDTDWV